MTSTGSNAPRIDHLVLGETEAMPWQRLASSLVNLLPDGLTPHALGRIAVAAQQLPLLIRQNLTEFRLSVPGAPLGGMLLSSLPLTDELLGETPSRFQVHPRTREAHVADMALLLLASLLGDPFSHAAVQGGSLILDICPIEGNENTQTASSSIGGLAWHNEDAYHDHRADWLLLLCLRNPQQAATTFARVTDVELGDIHWNALRNPIFDIAPDTSHLTPHEGAGPRRVPVISGPRTAPFIRVDPEFMESESSAADALCALIDQLGANLQDVVLAPGDVLILDNRRAVHGRRPFQPRYDGHDRWLRLVNVTADLRQSAHERSTSEAGTARHGRALRTQGLIGG